MLSAGAKRSRIYDYLLEHDQNVIQVDVDNLVRDHSGSLSTQDDNEATAREIAAFAAADPENLSLVSETDAGETGVISLATAHMRRIYGRFSEVLLVDCSHKTNRPERNSNIGKNFPEARILICHFHVIKYLKEMRSKPEFGKIASEDASLIDAAVHKMVYAANEDSYEVAHNSLEGICDRVGLNGFYAYFQKNWDSCKDRWVYYLRAHLPHFKNHTNNRLESFFGKLKDGVDGSMSMAQCVKALLAYDRRKERVTRIGHFVNSHYDEEMSTVLRFTSHYVAGQIEAQYAKGIEMASNTDSTTTRRCRKHLSLRLETPSGDNLPT
ncbi:Major Facilitator Superfamily (MFS) [Phytophthora nicotianae]|uniref:Major Facilitator Superfamily (MFS) n=1 Tax=Phytophthora nicotianae TaxID=4792 RepID=A0A0W8DLC0_PHYNI|nr:Major Facilitator Superfamily (MFS) [Phytophthora nicotianae]